MVDHMNELEKQIARFETAREELQETIREAHSAIKALRQTTKEAEEAIRDIYQSVHKKIEDHINDTVEAGLKEYKEACGRAIERTETNILDRFTRMTNSLMGVGRTRDDVLHDLAAALEQVAPRKKHRAR